MSKKESGDLKLNIEEVEPVWMPKGNKFIKVENPALMAHLEEKVRNTGKMFFEGAAKGTEFLRKNKNA